MPLRLTSRWLVVVVWLALQAACVLGFRATHQRILTQEAERVSEQLHLKVRNLFESSFYFYPEDQFKPQLPKLLAEFPQVGEVTFVESKGTVLFSTGATSGTVAIPATDPNALQPVFQLRVFKGDLWIPSGAFLVRYTIRIKGVEPVVLILWALATLITLGVGWKRPQWLVLSTWRQVSLDLAHRLRWRLGRWWGLRPQVLAAIAIANIFTGMMIAWSLSRLQTREYADKLKKESILFSVFSAEKVASDFTNLYYFFYQEKFLPSLRQVLASNENLRRIRLISVKHRAILLDSDALSDSSAVFQGMQAPSMDWPKERVDQLVASGQWISEDSSNRRGLTVVQTVRNENQEPWFFVEFNFGSDSLVRSLALIRRQILLGLIPAIALGLLISIVFAQLLISPIQKLVRAMKQVASGDYDVILKLSRSDEIGDLLSAFNRMTGELRKKKELRKYLSDSTYRQVMEAPDQGDGVHLKGTRLRAAVLFSDIRDFVRHCESLDAEEVTTLLTEYFSEMVESVYAHGGEVDKFIGDALLAVYYDGDMGDNTSLRAMQTALDMKSRLEVFNQRRKDAGKRPIEIGIGISHGEIISGPIGSKDRMDFTVIGDVVNVANRIEKMSKSGRHTKIVFSGPVEERVRGLMQYEPLAGQSSEIRGKSEGVAIFELIRVLDLKELKAQLNLKDLDQRVRSIQVLGQSENAEALEWIKKLLKDPEVKIRDEAAKAIQRLGDPEDRDLIEMLLDALSREKSEKVQATLISTIGKLCQSDALLKLIPYLDSENDRVVANAIEALGHITSSAVADLILPKLGSVNNRIKANAAMALFASGHLSVIDTLKPMLMHSNPLMRSSAAFAIGELTKLSRKEALMEEWKRLTPDVKQFLAELQETVPMLVSLLKDSEISVKRQAVIALGKIKDRSAVLPILDHIDLGKDSRELLMDVAQALREIGSHRLVREILDRLV